MAKEDKVEASKKKKNKICTKCGKKLSLSNFYKTGSRKYKYLRPECKKCSVKCDPIKRRNNYLKRKYGLTSKNYDKMLKKQKGVCAICGKLPKKNKHFDIDHSHKSGIIRGLLCSRCNHYIMGIMHDNIKLFGGVIKYLQQAIDLEKAGDYLDKAKNG